MSIADQDMVTGDSRLVTVPAVPGNTVTAAGNFEEEIFSINTSRLSPEDCDGLDNIVGEICFHNLTKENLILYEVLPGSKIVPMLLPVGKNTCPPKIPVKPGASAKLAVTTSHGNASYTFLFRTTDKISPKFATITLKAVQCVRKSVMLNPGNLFFRRNE